MRHGDVFHFAEDENGEERIDRERQPRAPIFDEQRNEDANEEKSVGDEVQRKLRKERRQFGHVAINAFDELARRVVVVKFHVEMQGVFGEFGAEGVGGCPRDVFAQPCDPDRDDLLNQRDADEGERGPCEGLQCFASQCGINKLSHNLRSENPQADTAE